MRIRKLSESDQITAADGTLLRELLHPDRNYPFDGRYSLASAIVKPGNSSLPHTLSSSEIYYILEGEGEMHVAEEVALVKSGDVIEIPAGFSQWIKNMGQADLVFLCIVDPAWRKEDEIIEKQ